ncbi:hypothetical protein LMJF_25_0400 [Leishmania major strain Friedlin]|uniref:Uncharacterized protein n=1 Tax=Leishmania major TaxID=5664 RepID=Q4QA55_LEIMA|nr:hypothetical protein LMJF_25_0400 [Leishmania major strain Friedlin]CAG9575049.1 hypothetical_protein_-_conserved [Leishmania major strain Friedlin]CAJ04658.1 hypothetical protein LMJF_25_0400 [Leishmania major strain Friedlin]|eukprot:XP_001683793.1 hypothetical protein LMJF_25_0400 [Leishmania major strain Friedlin]
MQGFFKSLVYKTFVSEASNTPLVQRAAEKAARMERDVTGEKLGLWLGAAAREVSNDIRSSYNIVRAYLNRDAVQKPQQSLSTAGGQTGSVGNGPKPPEGR